MKRLVLVLVTAGCSVVDEPYPPAWDPLSPPAVADCQHFEGTYADRGESPAQTARPSLTRELFGADSPWESAKSIRLRLTTEGASVTVTGPDKPLAAHFSAKEGDFRCNHGRLMLRSRRWVRSGLMSGRETVRVDFYEATPYLIAHVEERMTGVMFIVVPLAGESARWFRFPRLGP